MVSVDADSDHLCSISDNNPIRASMCYYGVIQEIWEVDYTAFKVPVFKCQWVNGCRNVPICGRARAGLTGALSKGGKMRGVATNVYLWKTSGKPKETGQNENSKFGSCIYA